MSPKNLFDNQDLSSLPSQDTPSFSPARRAALRSPIAIVSDDRIFSSYCRNQHLIYGFGTIDTFSLNSATQIITEGRPYDIIFLDLPSDSSEYNVWNLIHSLKIHWPHCLITVNSESFDLTSLQRARAAGADDFLIKHSEIDTAKHTMAMLAEGWLNRSKPVNRKWTGLLQSMGITDSQCERFEKIAGVASSQKEWKQRIAQSKQEDRTLFIQFCKDNKLENLEDVSQFWKTYNVTNNCAR